MPQTEFRTDTDRFFAWVELRNVSGVHPVTMKLYRPEGAYYGEETQVIQETNGIASWWRMVAWWRIQGEGIAQEPGQWRLDLLVDDTLQRSILLAINPGNPAPAALPPGRSNAVVSANDCQSGPLTLRKAGVCVIEASSDLVHWKAILTNTLPGGLLRDSASAEGGFRLRLVGSGASRCMIEASTDSLDWKPIHTNDLPHGSPRGARDRTPPIALFYRLVIPRDSGLDGHATGPEARLEDAEIERRCPSRTVHPMCSACLPKLTATAFPGAQPR